MRVQPRGGLVEHVKGATGVALGELLRQFYALRLATGERGGALAEAQVAKPDGEQRIELAGNRGHARKKTLRLLDRELEHASDVETLPEHLERFAVVALAGASVAGHVDVGQEVHLDPQHPVAFTG